MEPCEWACCYEGEPAGQDIHGPDGRRLEEAGALRNGGSHETRRGAVACWTAVMDENRHMVRKRNEFIAA